MFRLPLHPNIDAPSFVAGFGDVVGAFEIEPFNAATNAAARKAGELAAAGKVLAVAGGGDTVAALNAAGAADKFSYISTAGGAFLEWLEGKTLPGVAALSAG